MSEFGSIRSVGSARFSDASAASDFSESKGSAFFHHDSEPDDEFADRSKAFRVAVEFAFGALYAIVSRASASRAFSLATFVIEVLQLASFPLDARFDWGPFFRASVSGLFNAVSLRRAVVSLTGFRVSIALVFAGVAFALANGLYVGWAVRKQRYHRLWPFQVLRLGVATALSILYIPILTLLVSTILCRGIMAVPYSAVACWSAEFVVYRLLALPTLVVFGGATLALSATYHRDDLHSRHIFARAHARDTFIGHICKSLIIVLFVTVRSQRLMALLLLALCAVYYAACVLLLSIFSRTALSARLGSLAGVLWLSAVCVAHVFAQLRNRNALFLVAVCGAPLAGYLGARLGAWRLAALVRRYEARSGPPQSESSATAHRPAAPAESRHRGLAFVGAGAAASSLRERLLGLSGACFRYPFEAEVVARHFIRTDPYEAIRVFDEAVRVFPRSAYVRLCLARLHLSAGAHASAEESLDATRDLALWPDEQFLQYRLTQDLLRHRQDASAGRGMDLMSYIEFQSRFKLAREYHAAADRLIARFWALLLRSDEQFAELASAVVARLDAAESRARAYYSALLRRHRNSPALLDAFARFLETVTKEYARALSVRHRAAKTRARKAQTDREAESAVAMGAHFSTFVAVDDERDAVISIRADGSVVSINHPALVFFGYRRKDCIGQNVRMLVPAPHNMHHDDYLQRYVQTNEAHIIGKARRALFGRHAAGHLLPLHLSVTKVVSGGETLFVGVCEPREVKGGVLVVAANGIIQGATAAVSDVFGYSTAELTGANISTLMPPDVAAHHDGYLAAYLASPAPSSRIIGVTRNMTAVARGGLSVAVSLNVSEVRARGTVSFEAAVARMASLKAVLTVSPASYAITAAAQEVTAVLGYAERELIGRRLDSVVSVAGVAGGGGGAAAAEEEASSDLATSDDGAAAAEASARRLSALLAVVERARVRTADALAAIARTSGTDFATLENADERLSSGGGGGGGGVQIVTVTHKDGSRLDAVLSVQETAGQIRIRLDPVQRAVQRADGAHRGGVRGRSSPPSAPRSARPAALSTPLAPRPLPSFVVASPSQSPPSPDADTVSCGGATPAAASPQSQSEDSEHGPEHRGGAAGEGAASLATQRALHQSEALHLDAKRSHGPRLLALAVLGVLLVFLLTAAAVCVLVSLSTRAIVASTARSHVLSAVAAANVDVANAALSGLLLSSPLTTPALRGLVLASRNSSALPEARWSTRLRVSAEGMEADFGRVVRGVRGQFGPLREVALRGLRALVLGDTTVTMYRFDLEAGVAVALPANLINSVMLQTVMAKRAADEFEACAAAPAGSATCAHAVRLCASVVANGQIGLAGGLARALALSEGVSRASQKQYRAAVVGLVVASAVLTAALSLVAVLATVGCLTDERARALRLFTDIPKAFVAEISAGLGGAARRRGALRLPAPGPAPSPGSAAEETGTEFAMPTTPASGTADSVCVVDAASESAAATAADATEARIRWQQSSADDSTPSSPPRRRMSHSPVRSDASMSPQGVPLEQRKPAPSSAGAIRRPIRQTSSSLLLPQRRMRPRNRVHPDLSLPAPVGQPVAPLIQRQASWLSGAPSTPSCANSSSTTASTSSSSGGGAWVGGVFSTSSLSDSDHGDRSARRRRRRSRRHRRAVNPPAPSPQVLDDPTRSGALQVAAAPDATGASGGRGGPDSTEVKPLAGARAVPRAMARKRADGRADAQRAAFRAEGLARPRRALYVAAACVTAILLVSLVSLVQFDRTAASNDLLSRYATRRAVSAHMRLAMLSQFAAVTGQSDLAQILRSELSESEPAAVERMHSPQWLLSLVSQAEHTDSLVRDSRSSLFLDARQNRLLHGYLVCLRLDPARCPRALSDPFYDVTTRGLLRLVSQYTMAARTFATLDDVGQGLDARAQSPLAAVEELHAKEVSEGLYLSSERLFASMRSATTFEIPLAVAVCQIAAVALLALTVVRPSLRALRVEARRTTFMLKLIPVQLVMLVPELRAFFDRDDIE